MNIFSENPEKDLWRELLQFSYDANIERYLSKKGLSADVDTINCIVGSFLQAYEYYKSAKEANLQIAPLLLYYGSTNLLYGMINLLSGKINNIDNHGMKIEVPSDMKFISETKIKFNSPDNGGVHVFSKALGIDTKLTSYGEWALKEFLDSIAEINTDYIQCYGEKTGRIAMLDVFKTPDGKVEKVYFTDTNKDDLYELLKNVDGFSKSYLQPAVSKERETGKQYFVLRHKLVGKSICEYSYSGQPYLKAPHCKHGKHITLPTILNMYIILFALASLCRYFPERWSPFVLKDTTGEKMLIEKFIFYAGRMLPNYVLNILVENTVQYSSDRYLENDTVKLVGEHQVNDMIEKSIERALEKRTYNNLH